MHYSAAVLPLQQITCLMSFSLPIRVERTFITPFLEMIGKNIMPTESLVSYFKDASAYVHSYAYYQHTNNNLFLNADSYQEGSLQMDFIVVL